MAIVSLPMIVAATRPFEPAPALRRHAAQKADERCRQGRGGEVLRQSQAQRDSFRASCQAAELKIVASSIALEHPPVLLAFEFGFPPFACAVDRTNPTDEAFFHESEWIRREIHFDGLAI